MANHHDHTGKGSRNFIDADKILHSIVIEDGTVFLDAGCGDGYFATAASPMVGKTGMVLAIDVDGPSLDILSRQVFLCGLKNLKVVLSDISEKLPIADKTVDICILCNVLHGLVVEEKSSRAISELARVLKPGGKFAIIDFRKGAAGHGPPDELRLDPGEVEKLVTPFGFDGPATGDAGEYCYLLMFMRAR